MLKNVNMFKYLNLLFFKKNVYINVYSIIYMTKKYTIIIEKDEDSWLVSEVVELPEKSTTTILFLTTIKFLA